MDKYAHMKKNTVDCSVFIVMRWCLNEKKNAHWRNGLQKVKILLPFLSRCNMIQGTKDTDKNKRPSSRGTYHYVTPNLRSWRGSFYTQNIRRVSKIVGLSWGSINVSPTLKCTGSWKFISVVELPIQSSVRVSNQLWRNRGIIERSL